MNSMLNEALALILGHQTSLTVLGMIITIVVAVMARLLGHYCIYHDRDNKIEVLVPTGPFRRPSIKGSHHLNWKLGTNFRGKTYFEDRVGSRIVLSGGGSNVQDLLTALQFESLLAFTVHARSNVFEFKLAQSRAEIYRAEDQRQMSVLRDVVLLTIDALLASREHHRSPTVRTVRLEVMDRIQTRVNAQDPIQAEIRRRREGDLLGGRTDS